MNLGLAGKIVLVSGASRGIGLAIARTFAEEGARVALAARGSEALAQAVTTLPNGTQHLAVVADMTDEREIGRALAEIRNELGEPDIVVANVGDGASAQGGPIESAEWVRMMHINFFGAATLASLVVPIMRQRRQGNLLFVSSIAGLEAIGAPAPYCAAKSALQGMVKSLSRTFGPDGIRVNAVAPGNVWFPGGVWDRKQQQDAASVQSMLEREVPLRRLGNLQEISDVVAFLASERAAFVTGSTWVVDGGQTRQIG